MIRALGLAACALLAAGCGGEDGGKRERRGRHTDNHAVCVNLAVEDSLLSGTKRRLAAQEGWTVSDDAGNCRPNVHVTAVIKWIRYGYGGTNLITMAYYEPADDHSIIMATLGRQESQGAAHAAATDWMLRGYAGRHGGERVATSRPDLMHFRDERLCIRVKISHEVSDRTADALERVLGWEKSGSCEPDFVLAVQSTDLPSDTSVPFGYVATLALFQNSSDPFIRLTRTTGATWTEALDPALAQMSRHWRDIKERL